MLVLVEQGNVGRSGLHDDEVDQSPVRISSSSEPRSLSRLCAAPISNTRTVGVDLFFHVKVALGYGQKLIINLVFIHDVAARAVGQRSTSINRWQLVLISWPSRRLKLSA